MYKILNTRGLGVGGKQNELIELALTYKFDGVEVDMVDLVGRHDAMGKQFACQFLQSAKTDMGTFELPIKLGALNEDYGASIAKLDTMLDLAETLGCKTCYLDIAPNNENYSFQECFENYQKRLQELAERFAPHNIKIGLRLRTSIAQPPEGTFKFIQTADELVTLVKAVGHASVGICLDTWEWALGDGNVAQVQEAGFEHVTEIRLGDVAEGADRDKIKQSDRTKLPGDQANSFSFQIMQALLASGVEVPVSAATDMSTYAGAVRENVCETVSKQLDMLIEGKDPAVVAAEAEAAAAAEAAAEEGEESDSESESESATTAS